MAIGPAGELIRLAGDEAEKIRPKLEAELREAYEELVGEDGVVTRRRRSGSTPRSTPA